MHWVLESGLTDFGYEWLISTIKRHNLPHTFVKVIYGENILTEPDFDTFAAQAEEKDNIEIHAEKIFPMGTMGLSRIAKERNWTPGSLFNDEFTFERWSQGFGVENLLNEHSTVQKVSDPLALTGHSLIFARPCDDNKAFTGRVFTVEQFKDWQQNVISINDMRSKLNPETMITVAPYQVIQTEMRMFVVGGKVVTGSYYKIGAKVIYKEIEIGNPVIEYTQGVIKNYQPAQAFVIDIALTEQGFKIIEINNINSAGLYQAAVDKLVEALIIEFS